MKYIITVKTSYQISPDEWQVAIITRTADENTTLKEVEEWAKKNRGDLNTIQIHQNELT